MATKNSKKTQQNGRETVKQDGTITVKKDRFIYILGRVSELEEMVEVMKSVNPRMRPIQPHTKAQWQETVEQACAGIRKAIPKSLMKGGEEETVNAGDALSGGE